LQQQLAASQAAQQSLQQQLAAKATAGDQLQQQLTQSLAETDEQRRLRAESELQIEMLNAQLLSLRQQLARLVTALDASEAKAKADEVQVIDLGKRLNEALANKVEELARYRSEFFGKLREVLGNRSDIQIVGDRFIFQSEVLFDTGSAEIGAEGQKQLAAFADTLKSIAARIPPDINWVLRVDGHTDKRPYHGNYGTNWQLSTARAIAVVQFMIDQGIPANRLVAAGYAEFQPLDDGDSEDAYRRNRRIELKLDQR
jgi:chemotaxis protein MotB